MFFHFSPNVRMFHIPDAMPSTRLPPSSLRYVAGAAVCSVNSVTSLEAILEAVGLSADMTMR